MSVQTLVTVWEEALAQALSPTGWDEPAESDLEVAAGVAIRSSLQGGSGPSIWEICKTYEFATCGMGCGPP